MRKRITVYTTDSCSFCDRVKALLRARGLEYEEVNLSRDPDGRTTLIASTGMLSFPQVVVGDELVGGFSETLRASQDGRLQALLTAA